MESGLILNQADIKKLLVKLLKLDSKQVVQTKYSLMIKGLSAQEQVDISKMLEE